MPAPTPRTTSALVMGIIQTQTGIDLTPFIYVATTMTTNVCGNSGYTDGFVNSQMELIERWLAAHYYTIFDNQLANAKAGTVAVGYQYKVDYGLKCSMYGQNAMLIDTAGNLAALENTAQIKRKIKVGVWWAGKRDRWPGQVDFGDLCATIEQ